MKESCQYTCISILFQRYYLKPSFSNRHCTQVYMLTRYIKPRMSEMWDLSEICLSVSFFPKEKENFDEQLQTMEREDEVRRLAWKTRGCIVQHCFRTSMPLGGSPERWRHHRGNRWLVCPQWKNGWVAHFQTRRRLKHLPNVNLPRGFK